MLILPPGVRYFDARRETDTEGYLPGIGVMVPRRASALVHEGCDSMTTKNGVDVEQPEEALGAMSADPDVGQARFDAGSEWTDAPKCVGEGIRPGYVALTCRTRVDADALGAELAGRRERVEATSPPVDDATSEVPLGTGLGVEGSE